MKRLQRIVQFPYNLLALIITAGFVIRVFNLNFNSPFLDEAMYTVLGQSILAEGISEGIGAISWVGAFPLFYPLLSGILYNLGGILATRFFTVILGTLCIVLIYSFTKQLNLFQKKKNNEIAGLVASGIMATTAIPIETSRIAIYDGLSFTLFLLGLNAYLMAIRTNDKRTYVFTAVTLFLSFLAKYITVIFFPLTLVPAWFFKKERANILRFFALPLLLLTALYVILNASNLLGYFSSQVGNSQTSYIDVLQTFWKYSWIAYVLSFFAALFLWKSKKWYVIALLGMSFVPILLHVVSKNNNSAHQHSFLSLIFIMPLVGALFVFLISKYKKIGVVATIFFLLGNLVLSLQQVRDVENFWPNSNQAVAIIREKISSNDVILVEGGDTILLGLDKKISHHQIVGPFVFEYKGVSGDSAYTKAIEDGYFRIVELEHVYFSHATTDLIENSLEGRYTKIFDDGKIRVYERKSG